jgi:hypothetical protein
MRNMDDTYMDMYGCKHDDLLSMMNNYPNPMNFRNGHFMLAMSILSDAQEAMVHSDNETARQYINRAKFVLREWRLDNDNNPTN